MKTNSNTFKLVLTALMACLVMVAILFIRLPIPFTQGYVHLGDAMIFIAILILGWKYGALAGAIGGMLGDLVGGFAMWAPWTFCIKGLMAVIMGLIISAFIKNHLGNKKRLLLGEILGMAVAGVFMVVGYYLAEGIMYGNWVAPLLGVPWNIGQFAVGMIIALILSEALCKTSLKRHFTYK